DLRQRVPHPVEQLLVLADRRRDGAVRNHARVLHRRSRPPQGRPRHAALPGGAGHLHPRLHQRPGPWPGRVGDHARGTRPLPDRVPAGVLRGLDRVRRPPSRRCAMSRLLPVPAVAAALLLAACGSEPAPPESGANPTLGEYERGLLPSMVIANPAEWGDRQPVVPEGFEVSAIATDLGIPRQTLVLPNGDILVAEGRGGNAPSLKPKDIVAGPIKAAGTTQVASGNRLTLLRDADGDGNYELQTVFAEDLNAPYGLALINDRLYVANQDELVSFDYTVGQTRASGPSEPVTALPSEINHHWTKA